MKFIKIIFTISGIIMFALSSKIIATILITAIIGLANPHFHGLLGRQDKGDIDQVVVLLQK